PRLRAEQFGSHPCGPGCCGDRVSGGCAPLSAASRQRGCADLPVLADRPRPLPRRSEEHTSELQSRENLVCRLLLEKKNRSRDRITIRENRSSRDTNWRV